MGRPRCAAVLPRHHRARSRVRAAPYGAIEFEQTLALAQHRRNVWLTDHAAALAALYAPFEEQPAP